MEKALGGGAPLTRTELARVLKDAGIVAGGLRLAYLLMRAELDGVICSGPRRGKQFTYSLLDARAPGSSALIREEELAELATRYFSGHGTALLEDYAWWSGLTAGEARAGVEMAGPKLLRESRNGRSYWGSRRRPAPPRQSRRPTSCRTTTSISSPTATTMRRWTRDSSPTGRPWKVPSLVTYWSSTARLPAAGGGQSRAMT
jgi:winged helix DNA-binding protein